MLGKTLFNECRMRGIEVCASSRAEADVTNLQRLLAKGESIAPTHIVNCAAFTNVDGAERDFAGAFAINAVGAGNAASVAKDLGALLVHISTDYVFDGRGIEPLTEEGVCAPINYYGKTKWEGENRVLNVLPNACIMRTSWLFGGRGKNFISSILQGIKEKEELTVVSDQCGKPTYCTDAADAILNLLNCQGIVHFAGAEAMSRYEAACRLLSAAQERGMAVKCRAILPVPSSAFPTPAKRPAYSVLDTRKYTSMTQRQPKNWEAVLNELFNET